jgi:hypothetical protein
MGCMVKASQEKPGKKRYEKPKLRLYGDIRTLTQSAIGMNSDGGNPGHNMTR